MSDWKPYFNGRLRKDCEGFVVIVPQETTIVVPLWCPVCKMLLSTSEDSEYFRSRTCCYRCGMKWADPDRKRWMEGWRPSPEEVKKEVEFRQSIPVSLNLDTLGR